MRIENVSVYGLSESIKASGLPMILDYDYSVTNFSQGDLKRAVTLGNVKPGTGHDKFLRGIIVQFDLLAPRYIYQEWDTYHFNESLSSQQTVKNIMTMDLDKVMNDEVDPRVVDILKEKIAVYMADPSSENLRKVKSNVPEGLMLWRRVSSNYAQLKTMYLQRDTHRLPEWKVFTKFCLGLPLFPLLCLNKKEEKE